MSHFGHKVLAISGLAALAASHGVDPELAALLGPSAAPSVATGNALTGYGYPNITGGVVTGGYPYMIGAAAPAANAAWLQNAALASSNMHAVVAQQQQQQLLADAAKMRNAVVFDERQPNKVIECGFGFDVTPVTTGATVQIIRRPQVFFRPQRLVIPSDIGGVFRVQDIRVGKEPVFVVAGSVPGRVFAENATGNQMRPTTASVSQDITLTVTNTSLATQNFEAWMQGVSVE